MPTKEKNNYTIKSNPNRIRSIIKNHMTKKGWRLIGHGGYAMVFANRNSNKVIKINIPDAIDDDDYTVKQLVRDIKKSDNITARFLRYIDKNKNNPHLPKYSQTKTETVQGIELKLYEMEKLLKPSDFFDEFLVEMLDVAWSHKDLKEIFDGYNYSKFKWISKQGREFKGWDDKYGDNWPQFKKDVTLLIKTMSELLKIAGDSKSMEEDLERNWMVRADGTPVIIDPWTPDFDW